jgi:hypothetical protein
MNAHIAQWMTRIHQRFDRIRDDMRRNDCPQAMADCAELQTQAEFLYAEIQKFYKKQLARRDATTTTTAQKPG